jgi:hypothetical protein
MAPPVSAKMGFIPVEGIACHADPIQYGEALLLLASAHQDSSSSIISVQSAHKIKPITEVPAFVCKNFISSTESAGSAQVGPVGMVSPAFLHAPVNLLGTVQRVPA